VHTFRKSTLAQPIWRESPFHQPAEYIEDRWRMAVTIELKKCDEIVAQADLLSGG
jgi:hypothetical protein